MNILGSIFYGVILGIFLVAFFLPKVRGTAVLVGAALAQIGVVALFFTADIGFLWFNLIGCVFVLALASGLQLVLGSPENRSPA